MLITKAARRYADALLDVAGEQNSVEELLEDVRLIGGTVEGSPDLMVFLKSPVIRYDDKLEALKKIFEERVNETTMRFIALLARKNRIDLLDQVTGAFIEAYNEAAGIIQVEVAVATALDEPQREALHRSLEEKTGKKVEMTTRVDTSLRGGMSVRIDDTVIDGTIKHKLEELEQQLLSASDE